MSSFKGVDYFGSGPHRFSFGPRGQLVSVDFFDGGGSGSTAEGLTDWTVTITGRLTASSEGALRTLRDALIAALEPDPTPGTLVDSHAHSWTDLSFIKYAETGPVCHGRVWSIPYTAVFQAL